MSRKLILGQTLGQFFPAFVRYITGQIRTTKTLGTKEPNTILHVVEYILRVGHGL